MASSLLPTLFARCGPLTEELLQSPARFGLGMLPERAQPDGLARSVCGFCSTGCALDQHLQHGAAIGVTPAVDYPVNRGLACPKGWEALTVLRSDDRAVTPLLRGSSGQLEPVDWDSALRSFVVRMKAIQGERGPEAVAFLGTGQLPSEELAFFGALAKFVWPLNVKGFGGRFTVTPDRLPEKGADPVKIVEAKAWIANLEPDEGTAGIAVGGAPGGLLALYQKCVHLGCTVPWLPDFDFQGEKGWFRCPCHQSTYTKAGIRVFGPAPRHLDTFEIEFDAAGRLTINTGKITLGAEDNPSRAIPF